MGTRGSQGLRSELVRRIYIGKVPVDIVEPRNLLVVLAGLLQRQDGAQIVFARSWDIYRAQRNQNLLNAMKAAALVLPVSNMILAMAGFLGHPRPHRYYPFDSIIRILTWLESMDGSLFLLGGSGQQIASVEQRVRQTYPHVRLLGKYAGAFPRHMDASVVLAVQKANPHVLLSGGGLPGRDLWLYRRKNRLNKGLMLWSGEWFDFVIQRRRRPVKTAVRRGHQWISEFYTHPLKVFRAPLLGGLWLRLLFLKLFR